MKLKYKILIGTVSAAALLGIIIPIAIKIPADGIHNGVGLKGVIYKTNQSQQQDSIKEQLNETNPNSLADLSNAKIINTEPNPKEENQKQEEKIVINQNDEQLKAPILAEQPINPFTLPEIIQEEVKVDGFSTKAKIRNQPERIQFLSDQKNKISNPDQYISDHVPNVVALELTDQFSKYTAKKAASEFKQTFSSIAEALRILDGRKLTEFLAKDTNYWNRLFARFTDLFNNPNLKNFLTDEGLAKFNQFNQLPQLERFAKYFAYLDTNKLNELSADAKAKLQKGEVLESRNLYVDSKGRLNSSTFTPLPGFNKVIARLDYENKNKRIFKLKDIYNRKPDNILNGEYDGWIKRDVTQQYLAKGIKIYDGVSIAALAEQSSNTDQKQDKLVVTFDFSNPQTKANAKQTLLSLKENNQLVTGYRVINISNSLEDTNALKEVLANLPDKILLLELIFNQINSTALAALENKSISELSLYTTNQDKVVDFAINPLYLRNVSWINTNNIGNDLNQINNNYKHIVFNTITFNQEDINKSIKNFNNPLSRINLGLRMAYWVRNNEPFFQGFRGSGKYTDHNEFANGYPANLDLSNTNLKTLAGLEFDDKKKLSNGFRLLHSLKLANNSEFYTLNIEEMNNALFAKVMNLNPNLSIPSTITFSNGLETKMIKLTTNNPNQILSSDGIANLKTLLKTATSNFNNKPIIVSKNSVALIKQLQDHNIAIMQQ